MKSVFLVKNLKLRVLTRMAQSGDKDLRKAAMVTWQVCGRTSVNGTKNLFAPP
jgi:hypothetical protein